MSSLDDENERLSRGMSKAQFAGFLAHLEREAEGLPPLPDPLLVKAVVDALEARAPRPLSDLPDLLTAEEAAGVLRCSRRTLGRLVASGRLHASRQAADGSSPLLIARKDLTTYMAKLAERSTR